MLYTETEVFMGPNLNVIIGPNGSGKSTIGKISYYFVFLIIDVCIIDEFYVKGKFY